MPKLYSSAHIVKVLQACGFYYISQKGSHTKFRKTVGRRVLTVIVPAARNEIPYGTFRSIVRQAELTEDDFKTKRR